MPSLSDEEELGEYQGDLEDLSTRELLVGTRMKMVYSLVLQMLGKSLFMNRQNNSLPQDYLEAHPSKKDELNVREP
ncbi:MULTISPECIES: hypothetical protein [unclassified Paenibacillus]|uniref:hypothetical protein n=1 Tax=unclassified Paenibacillus TaxID=185978 RepID=UPI0004F840C3|nr:MULTISPECIES: hypothetical protein [unclassified Paenibacillus]AIQ26132.1 hypothetical protein H70737_26810 [Paenibacillus sp. FSL H7-0737]KAA1188683.1 hypothetical protein PAENI_07425 [Paenibacillus sp. B2(2019)]